MSSITPGPWQSDSKKLVIRRGQGSKMGFAREAREDCYLVETANGGHRHIAFVRSRINARLIAAAPEMAELLEEAIQAIWEKGKYIFTSEKIELADHIKGLLRRIEGEEDTE